MSEERKWRIAHSEFSLGWGGQEHRVIAELEGFKERGHDVWLIAPAKSQVFARAQAMGIPTREIPTGKLALIGSSVPLAHWLGQNQIDVLNTHSSKDGWFVALAGRMAGVPLVIRTRHIEVDYKTPWISRHAFTTLADHVLTTSDRIRDGLARKLGLPLLHLTTLPTGIDLNRFQRKGSQHEYLQKLGKKRKLIGMISVLRSWKGHKHFIEAGIRMLEAGVKADFVITGEGPQRKNITRLISESGYPDQFHLLGHTEDVPGVLRSLDVLAIPSYQHEGVPQIGLQALACETPVVGSDIGGIPEIIRPGETGRIFPAQDIVALAEQLGATLKQKKETARMVANGRALVERQHSRGHMIDVLDGLYVRLIRE